jgi:hypothetical protein
MLGGPSVQLDRLELAMDFRRSMQRGAMHLTEHQANSVIDGKVAPSDYLTAPTAPCTRDRVGLQQENRQSIHVRELGLRWPFDESLQYPQDSLL